MNQCGCRSDGGMTSTNLNDVITNNQISRMSSEAKHYASTTKILDISGSLGKR